MDRSPQLRRNPMQPTNYANNPFTTNPANPYRIGYQDGAIGGIQHTPLAQNDFRVSGTMNSYSGAQQQPLGAASPTIGGVPDFTGQYGALLGSQADITQFQRGQVGANADLHQQVMALLNRSLPDQEYLQRILENRYVQEALANVRRRSDEGGFYHGY